mgnify:CR=1 FL=1
MYKKVVGMISAALLALTLFPISSMAAERYEVLTVGDQDKWVFEMQQVLYDNGYMEFPATGYFGTDTQNAVLKFQEENDIPADGKAGPETRMAILDSAYTDMPETRITGEQVVADESAVQTSNSVSYNVDGPASSDPATSTSNITGSENTNTNNTSATPQSSGASGSTFNPGDKGDAISTLQQTLKDLEYYDYATITGYYGPMTEEAVKKFQRTHGLSETGIWDQSCQDLLDAGSARAYTMYPGDKNEDILKMQQRLKDLGYFSAEPTGYYGDATLAAVMAFQQNNGLTADGKAGKQTRSILYSDSAVAAQTSPAPAPDPQPDNSTPTEEQPAEQVQPPVEETPAETVPVPEPQPDPVPETSESTGAAKVIELAQAQVGKPYSYGSNGPNSFDCSGFVYYVLKNSGYSISRYSSATYAYLSQWATVSDVNSLAAGDLVFFKSDKSDNISHMGIYVGGGSFIHAAPSSGGVAVSGMTSGYYQRNFVTAKRIF